MTLDMRLLTLVPNHLSTVKKYQSTPSISHPYSSQFTTFHPSNLKTTTLHQSGEEKRGVEEKEKGEKKCGTAREKEKMRFREVHIDTNP